MTYPYIGEGKNSGSIALIYDKAKCITLKSKTWASDDLELCEGINERFFKNITTEYLANTYGEVKNKEHAEFIVKLSGGNSSSIGNSWSQSLKCFVIDSDGKVSFGSRVYHQEKVGKRGITIPLPPECEEKIYRYESMGQKPKHFDCVCTKCGGRCCIGNCDEWPRVGDDVVLDDENGIVKLPADAQDYYIVEVNGLYKQCKFGELSKPKTPEQELRDDISDLAFNQFNDDSYDLTHNAYYLAEKLISKYDIKKKL